MTEVIGATTADSGVSAVERRPFLIAAAQRLRAAAVSIPSDTPWAGSGRTLMTESAAVRAPLRRYRRAAARATVGESRRQ